ncbi:MAG TPA: AAA family ATPase [Xanthobacteraceae bacterium]|nr:AAA family ATPase [Xanthobacteraceae bacterium]
MSGIFQPAASTSAHLKMGLLGFQGGGKTFTAGMVAIGLFNYLKDKGVPYAGKPVAFFDTETGSDWLIPHFKAANVPFFTAKKRNFADLLSAVKEAEQHASILIIDSITHPWRELCDAYMKRKERTFLQMDDWSYLKGQYGWAQFTDLFINSKLHIIMCGRAGHEFSEYRDDNGKRQLEKTGTKMKTEGETGFEPSLLVLMEQDENLRTGKVGHKAIVQKDRSTIIDGREFRFSAEDDNGNRLSLKQLVAQTFGAFLPHIENLAIGSDHVGVDASGDSRHILKTERKDWQPVQREICIEEIQNLLALHFPTQSAEDKKAKLKAVLEHFDATWTEIEKVMPLPDLRAGYDSLHRKLAGKPSRYAAEVEKMRQPIDDEIPEHPAPPTAADASSAPASAAMAEAQADIPLDCIRDPALLEKKLLDGIPKLMSMGDCAHYTIEIAKLGNLPFEHRNRVNTALLKRQGEIIKAENPALAEAAE